MKILHNISLIKTSSAEPLASQSGVIYSSGSSVYLTDKSGAVFDLAANKGSMVITEYVTPGIYTWNKNPSINFDIKYLQVVCVGAGAGGGGGQSGATNSSRSGGGGGGGGSIATAWFESSSLTTSSYTIQVGTGGNGGAGGGSGGADGNTGNDGNDSFFRSGSSTILVQGKGGKNGSTYSVGGDFSPAFTPNLFYQLVGSKGGNASTSPNFNNTPLYSFNSSIGTGGGGGGGGINTSNTAQAGATGSAVFKNGQLIFTGSAGTANGGSNINGQNGVNNFINGLVLAGFSSSLYSSSYGVGTPGHGGGASSLNTINGGNGGSGSIGCGGGGGGAGTSGGAASAGNGGKGGDGYVLLIAYY